MNNFLKITSVELKIELEDPNLPRLRKIPKRLENTDNSHVFSTAKAYYKHVYIQVHDKVFTSLNERFSTQI